MYMNLIYSFIDAEIGLNNQRFIIKDPLYYIKITGEICGYYAVTGKSFGQ
jgi:hypothetical protein